MLWTRVEIVKQVGLALGIAAIVAVLVITMRLSMSAPPKEPLFSMGTVVLLKLDGQRVMVTRVKHRGPTRGWWYDCRVPLLRQRRRDGFVSADTEITSYSIVTFREFELESPDNVFDTDSGE